VYVIQNHDQVGNRAFGERLHQQIDMQRYRAASTLLLFLPYTPMLFMGQEFGASSPFQYFTDHNPELGRLVTEGRRREFKAFSAFADPATREKIPDPQSESTFLRSKLPLDETGSDLEALYQNLLQLRRTDPVLMDQNRQHMQARALSPDVLAVRRWRDGQERLLVVNFGDSATRMEGEWRVLLDSGAPSVVEPTGVSIQGRGATILARGAA
jgi:maltooligosyltrehalose trehalohydrolase